MKHEINITAERLKDLLAYAKYAMHEQMIRISLLPAMLSLILQIVFIALGSVGSF